MSPKSTTSILGTLFVYSGIPHIQGLPSQLRGFSPLLLRLHGEISLSLLCSHSSWGSALVLAPPLHVSHPQASVPCPDRRGLKQQLIRTLLVSQAGEREGYASHNWNARCACGGRGHVMLQQPEVCSVFSRGSCPWIRGPWQWWAAQAPGRLWVVTCACTQGPWWQQWQL